MNEIILETGSILEQYNSLKRKVEEQAALIKYYEELLRLNRQKKFGASSEKTSPGQRMLPLFDEPENEADKRAPEPAAEQITYARRKSSGKKDEDLSDMPVETVTHSIPEEERICPECGGAMHVMGHSEPRREIVIIPAEVKVVEHVREVYACRNCENNGTSVPVIKAPIPEPVIKGSAASPSAVAHIMVQKYVNALPLYRQEMDLISNGYMLSRQTMANWMIYCSAHWLEPLHEMMRRTMLVEDILHADETTLQVLKEPGRASRSVSYMWLYETGIYSSHQIALYEYQETRSSSHPVRFLEGFKGFLHCDGYSGYRRLEPCVTISGCWAHARRYFIDALKASPPDERENAVSKRGVELCDRLFALEREYKEAKLTPEERQRKRLEQSRPVSDAVIAWASEVEALPKSLLGRAVRYLLGQKTYLENIYRDGRLELSNNRAERAIRPFVIGRRNWLFSATPKGARASAIIYSMIQTAKLNGLKPFEYLQHIFETIPNVQPDKYGSLLPWSKSLPEKCKLVPH